MFSDRDVRTAAKVCVLGKTTADKLFPDEDPVGKIIRIKNVPFRCSGVLTPRASSMFGSDQDDVVIVPYTSAMKRFAGVTTLRSINVQAATRRPDDGGAEAPSPTCCASVTASSRARTMTSCCATSRKSPRP